MEKYELTIVLPGKVTTAKKKSIGETLAKIIKVTKGKLGDSEDWGEVNLAYQIKKNLTGVFITYNLELEKGSVVGVNDKLRMEEEILRYLLVKKDKS